MPDLRHDLHKFSRDLIIKILRSIRKVKGAAYSRILETCAKISEENFELITHLSFIAASRGFDDVNNKNS